MLDLSQRQAYKQSTAKGKVSKSPPPRWGRVPPSAYKSTYAALPTMTGPDSLKHAFGNGASTHSVPLISRNPVQTFPGVWSFDEPNLEFLRALSDVLNKKLPVDVDKDGFTSTGVHASFDKLRCPAGYFANPMSYTPVNNAQYREELGLTAGYTPRQRKIAEEVWREVWKQVKVAKVNVPKLSTGGVRRFTFDVQWKLAFAEWLLESSNFERMLNSVDKEDWETLANEYETLFMTYIQKRGQVDSPGKVRTVFDLDYALSAGTRGRAFPADKKVTINGVEYPDFSAIRARVVHAGPWAINCYLQIVATSTMASLFARFPRTFHINTREEILSVVSGRYVSCSDVTEYDRSMSRDALKLPHDIALEYWDPRIVKASWRLCTSPYYSKPLDVNGGKGVWVMDPRDWTTEVFAGNRSGHAWTSLFAKVNKVIETMFIFDRMFPVLGFTAKIMRGESHMGMVNNGDDEIVWATVKADIDRFNFLRKDRKLGHYLVEPEIGQGFSGLLLRRTGETEYDPCPRIHTTFEKMWIPERSIGGRHREFWVIGLMTRIDNIMSSENGRLAWEEHMKLYRRIMEPRYGDFNGIMLDAMARTQLRLDALTANDRALLEAPEKIHHRFTSEDISPDVLDLITSNIPERVVESFINRYYKGSLL